MIASNIREVARRTTDEITQVLNSLFQQSWAAYL
jgi:hypothetical protein